MPDDSALQFEGNAELLKLLAGLYPRRRRDRRKNRPLIGLVRDAQAPEVLPAVHERIRSGLEISQLLDPDPANPPPNENLPPTTIEDVTQVGDLLVRLARKLGQARDRRQRIRRFRRFALVTWLMAQQLGPDDVDQETRERTMRALLGTRDRYQIPEIPNDLGVPPWLRAVAIPLTALLSRARISGRVPVLSGYYRWFVRRDSLAPRRAGNMPSVAA
ncbi:MAG TPA: hypothetical protein VNP03_22625, partial [Pseudonocardia sp.]|nr:hypothetical protein [Pseudonocardia sp.]